MKTIDNTLMIAYFMGKMDNTMKQINRNSYEVRRQLRYKSVLLFTIIAKNTTPDLALGYRVMNSLTS